ncbi:SDR family oxidoreductase [Commensalibacter oyaizuii]|uniref:SDR family oxidoreductase n=1 Tax=Commensalibacter oyaizuii TaxID=3043873 RepID=A0ABT6Q3X9_9PROT|nr:SDR family oxidoreductase [Commensalibacter sp. TBRC 16381]MDI2091837.1 SDR family oxidoreductase [Commensalibacter sp. TBRC 16381]
MSDLHQRHKNTIALITGGAQGVGHAIAKQLIAEGCSKIMLAGRDCVKGQKAVERLGQSGVEIDFISIDLQNVQDCLDLVTTTIQRFGDLNVLVNAAAFGGRGTLIDTDIALWDMMFDTNARAPFFIMQGFVKHRQSQGGGGAIVNILSQCVHCGQSYLAAYSASKGALATLTKNVANAYRFDRIRCNAILPGWMDTPGEDITQRRYHGATDGWLEKAEASQPMGQLCKTYQLAELASYVLSPTAGVMTGALIDYDQNIVGVSPE